MERSRVSSASSTSDIAGDVDLGLPDGEFDLVRRVLDLGLLCLEADEPAAFGLSTDGASLA